MKKKLLIVSIVFSLLVMVPIISMVNAASTAEFTGVQEQTYTWTATIDNTTLQAMYDDFRVDLESAGALDEPITKKNISDMSVVGLNHRADVYEVVLDKEGLAADNVTLVKFEANYSAGGQNIESLFWNYSATGMLNTYMLENQTFRMPYPPLYNVSSMIPPVISWAMPNVPFVPSNTNWSAVVSAMDDILTQYVSLNPLVEADNYTIAVSEKGVKVTYAKEFLDGSYSAYTVNQNEAIEYTIQYDANGILSLIDVKYGETSAIKWTQGAAAPAPPIPGYGLITLLGISAVAMIGVIYLSKRKKLL